jgi:small-conductance mechanosensitive channel/CRP-like cAMP-binding protein
MADAIEWLHDHINLFGGSIFLATVAVTLVLTWITPRNRRGQLRGPAILIAGYLLATVLQWLFPDDASFHSFLAGCTLFCLLSALGLTVLLVYTLVLDRVGKPLPRLTLDLLQLAIFAVVLVMALHRAGVDWATLFTGSTILTAVVALALRDTLSNLIAGLVFQLQPPFQVGDWIQINHATDSIGEITEINWRAIRMVTNEQVEVSFPNGLLVQAAIRNFSRPERWSARSVFVRTPFDVPPNRVRQIILEAIRDSWGVCGVPAPAVFTHGFTDSGVEYWVRFFTGEFSRRAQVESGVRDRIWYALAREGIAIPTATRQVKLTHVPPPSGTEEERLDRRRRQLAAVGIFSILSEPALGQLAASAREQRFANGEAIIRQGDRGDCLYLIEDGEVAVLAREGTSKEVEVSRMATGEVFGEMSLLTGEPRSATVMATSECRLLLVDKPAFEPILRQHPELAERLSQILIERQMNRRSRLGESASSAEPERNRNLFRRIREFFAL